MTRWGVYPRIFTLVELLVVIAIIGILAGLLMPSLSRALEQARRTLCLSDKKELVVATTLYCGDNRDYFPHRTLDFKAANPDRVANVLWQSWGGNSSFWISTTLYPLGTLAMMGYAEEWTLFLCPGMEATPDPVTAVNLGVWKDQRAAFNRVKDAFSDPAALIVPVYRVDAGVSEHFYQWAWGGIPEVQNPPHQYTWPNTSKMGFVASYWNSPPPGRWTSNDPNNQAQRGAVSPALFSCNNVYNSVTNWSILCHKLEGLNVGWFDGSARWVSAEEVWATGGSGLAMLKTCKPLEALCVWFRKYATPHP
ncbi:MAG: prepilin-type N-terminal cleavage/methylation domain-containing protein [Planctomycetes bacterium]|nr:prepilin-type N-terminal cleavage/methylation domain-containing protein [Planctomycetota bacterium]